MDGSGAVREVAGAIIQRKVSKLREEWLQQKLEWVVRFWISAEERANSVNWLVRCAAYQARRMMTPNFSLEQLKE